MRAEPSPQVVVFQLPESTVKFLKLFSRKGLIVGGLLALSCVPSLGGRPGERSLKSRKRAEVFESFSKKLKKGIDLPLGTQHFDVLSS